MPDSVPITYTGNTPLSALQRKYRATVESASTDIKARYPSITRVSINGATPQLSRVGQGDTRLVITVDYYTNTGDRVVTIEAHDDMTYNGFVG